MQPSERHSLESRRARINEATQEYREITRMAQENAKRAKIEVGTEYPHDNEIAAKLAPGVEFVGACEIRVVPKVAPRGRLQIKAAIMKSRVFIPGVRYRIDGLAMVKSSGKDASGKPAPGKQWYRVSVIGTSGGVLFRGFILQTAIRGAICQPAA